MEKNIKENWEKEFNKHFNFEFGGETLRLMPLECRQLKDFISKLLSQEKQKWIEELGKAEGKNFRAGIKEGKKILRKKLMKKIEEIKTDPIFWDVETEGTRGDGYRQAIDEIIRIIKYKINL